MAAPNGGEGRFAKLYSDTKDYFADGGIVLDKRTILKVSTVGSGCFLILAGILGTSSLILGGGLTYFVGCLYAIIFGLLVQVIEIKNKFGEPPDRIKPFYQLVDIYLKFLTLQRGKGLFYMGVGLLCFFIAPSGTGSAGIFGRWGVMNFSSMLLAAVGGAHTFQVVTEKPGPSAAGGEGGVRPAEELDFSSPMDFSSPYPGREGS